MPSRLKMRHVFFATGMFVLMAYQNCAQAPEDSSLSSASSYQSKLPFAYQAQLDTIAYMSCSDVQAAVDTRAYFTIRAGAYKSTNGLSVSDEYLEATKYYTTTDRAKSLALSERNANMRLTLSIRDSSNLQQVWTENGGDPVLGKDKESFVSQLDSDEIAGPLAALGSGSTFRNYFPGASEKRLLEASVRFYKYDNITTQTRNNLSSNSAILVAGFTNSGDESDAKLSAPSDFDSDTGYTSKTRVYGVGYRVGFTLPLNVISGQNRVLANSVSEINLANNSSTGPGWTCPSEFQFKIVRPEDKIAGRVVCNTGVDRATSAQQARLDAIRRVLRVEDWYVDVANNCVVPRSGGDYCYGAAFAQNSGTKFISYNATSCVDSATTTCPHYVSVCVRN